MLIVTFYTLEDLRARAIKHNVANATASDEYLKGGMYEIHTATSSVFIDANEYPLWCLSKETV